MILKIAFISHIFNKLYLGVYYIINLMKLKIKTNGKQVNDKD